MDNLEVDHIDPDQKISHKVWSWAKPRRDAELAKCQVLCNKCHKNKTLETFRTITRCPQGHEYTIENTYFKHGRRRICRACGRDYVKRKRAVAQLGRASALGAEGREFESRQPDQN